MRRMPNNQCGYYDHEISRMHQRPKCSGSVGCNDFQKVYPLVLSDLVVTICKDLSSANHLTTYDGHKQ